MVKPAHVVTLESSPGVSGPPTAEGTDLTIAESPSDSIPVRSVESTDSAIQESLTDFVPLRSVEHTDWAITERPTNVSISPCVMASHSPFCQNPPQMSELRS
jgi:hypothetical protein